MSRVSLVITDVEGTLVTQAKVLTPRAIAAVQRLHENGIGFSICSSRPPFGLRMMIEPLRLRLPFDGYNVGAIRRTGKSERRRAKADPARAARQAVAIFREHAIDCWVFVGNEWLIANPAGDHVDLEIHTIRPRRQSCRPLRMPILPLGKIVGPSNDHGRVALVTDLMQSALAGRASAARSQPYYCDVIPPGVNKGRIVELLGERLNVPRSEILVLGDMENDIEMFRMAGFAVVMGNATDAVKREAQATTLSNEEDGFAVAIERHVFGG